MTMDLIGETTAWFAGQPSENCVPCLSPWKNGGTFVARRASARSRTLL